MQESKGQLQQRTDQIEQGFQGKNKEVENNEKEGNQIFEEGPEQLEQLEGEEEEEEQLVEKFAKGRPFTAGTPSAEITLLKKSYEDRSEEDCFLLESLLSRVHFGTELSQEKRMALCKYLHFRVAAQGEVLFNQGDEGQEFFIILKGAVLVKIHDDVQKQQYIAAELYQGDAFGELALTNPNSRRRATCVCASETELAVLHRSHYQEILADDQIRSFQERLEFFRQCTVIGDLSDDRLQGILRIVTKRDYLPKEVILQQGQENEDLYVIVKGGVKVVREMQDDFDKRMSELNRIRNLKSLTVSVDPMQDYKYKQMGIKQELSEVKAKVVTRHPRSKEQREAILSRAKTKVRNVIRRINCNDVQTLRWEVTIQKAKEQRPTTFTEDMINAFQYMSILKRPQRLFLEVAALGKNDIFGEKSLTKSTVNASTVLTTCGTSVYIINKWDLLKRITKETAAQIVEQCSSGSLDENTLKDRYAELLQWKDFKKLVVKEVITERKNKRTLQPIYIWNSPHRNFVPTNQVSKFDWKV